MPDHWVYQRMRCISCSKRYTGTDLRSMESYKWITPHIESATVCKENLQVLMNFIRVEAGKFGIGKVFGDGMHIMTMGSMILVIREGKRLDYFT
jgi:hypothetical protein